MNKHIIVDGSNIATEGRTEPSLAQLHEAVIALMDEYPDAKISVVVDATFGHRIAKKEVAEFNKAIENNELVAPPAGAVGRGDAFVLAIADKVNAAVLSNDSYQEFHGKYKWLFDESRLIGGKPVPHIGWVFVERLPVRGTTSRRSVKTGGLVSKTVLTSSPEANQPMPVPKAPPPTARAPIANEVMPFLQFVEKHPAGTKVKAVVDTYAANGITVRIGDVSGYVPLRNMASPVPRSARDLYKIGDVVTLMVVGFTPSRRSVDLGVPEVVASMIKEPTKRLTTKVVAKKVAPAKKAVIAKKAVVVKKTVAKKPVAAVAAKKVAPTKKVAPVKKAVIAKKAVVVKKTVAKKPVAAVDAKKSAPKK